jgi:hypothetical protein
MWQIDGRIQDSNSPRGQASIFLNANKPLTPWEFIPPITWTGLVNEQEVEIVQKSAHAFSIINFDFKIFPDKYSHLKGDIVHLIDKKLRKLD